MARVLITGATGFTGLHLAAELARHGDECVGMVPQEAREDASAFQRLCVANLLDASRLAEVVREVRPQRVVHLAAIAHVAHGQASDFYQTNIVGTRNLLEALTCLPTPPDMTLLASSANIYGNSTADPIGEETSPAPANDYAVSKLAMEHVARLFMDRIPIALARPFNYTGVGQSEGFLLAKIVAHARRKEAGIELGNLDVARDFSDVRVVVNCFRRLLACKASAGLAVNVCSGRAHTLRDIVALVEDLSGHRLPITVNPAFVRSNEVAVLRGSRARLETLIGPVADIPLDETLRWMLQG